MVLNFEKLESFSAKLNESSDHLTEALTTINSKLNSLNLGLEARATDPFWQEEADEGRLHCFYLGYGKSKGAWGLIVRMTIEEETVDQEAIENNLLPNRTWTTLEKEDQFLLETPRKLRVKAIEKIPELIEQLEAEAEQAVRAVDEAGELASKL